MPANKVEVESVIVLHAGEILNTKGFAKSNLKKNAVSC